MNTRFTLTVSPKHTGLSLHDFLSAQFPFFAVTDWADVILANSLLINERPTAGNPTLGTGSEIQLVLRNYQEDPVNKRWTLAWQNDSLLVVNKPALLPVQRTTRNIVNTLTNLVRRDLNLAQAQPLHRLDLETAGLMVLAKTKADSLQWQPQFQTLLAKKTYRAIVWGTPTWQEKQFTSQLATQAQSKIRCQMYVSETDTQGKTCTTHFRVIHTGAQFSMIECDLLTGRKHQIRAQLAYLGHPIVGDKIYAHEGQFYLRRLNDELTEQDRAMLKTPHHLLVACELELAIKNGIQTVTLGSENFPDAWKVFSKTEFGE